MAVGLSDGPGCSPRCGATGAPFEVDGSMEVQTSLG